MSHESRVPSFPGYQFIEKIGQGGMGAVYRVRRESVDFALKTILHHNEIELLSRFEREALAAAAVDKHPNIVSIHKLELNVQPPFILMDFVEGQSLDQWMAQNEPWPLEKVIEFLEPLAGALDHMHSKGVIHRDLKPANILIRDHDKAPLITDFGLAKVMQLDSLTQSGQRFGTPNYMAPEQFEGKKASSASDLWALAVISYELLSGGERPFQGESSVILAQNVLTKPPRPLPRDLKLNPAVIRFFQQTAFAKRPEDRVKSAALLIEALQAKPPTSSKKLTFAGASLALLSLLGGSGYLYLQSRKPTPLSETHQDLMRDIRALREHVLSKTHKSTMEDLILSELLAEVAETPRRESAYLSELIERVQKLRSKVDAIQKEAPRSSRLQVLKKRSPQDQAYQTVLFVHDRSLSSEKVLQQDSPLLEALLYARKKEFPKVLNALKNKPLNSKTPFELSYSIALIQLKLRRYQDAIEAFKVSEARCPTEFKDALNTAYLEARAYKALKDKKIPKATLLFYKLQEKRPELRIDEARFRPYLKDGRIDLDLLGQHCNRLCLQRQSGAEFMDYLVESLKLGIFLQSFTEANLELIELHDRSELDSRKRLLNRNRSFSHRFWHDYYRSFKESGKDTAGERAERELFEALQALTTHSELPQVYRSLIHFQIAWRLRQRSKPKGPEPWTAERRKQFFAGLSKAQDFGYPAPDQISWELFRAREDEFRSREDVKQAALELIPIIQEAIRALKLREKLTREKSLTQGRPPGQAYLQVALDRLPRLFFDYYGKLARAQHCAQQLPQARESLRLALKYSPYLRCPPNTLEILIELKDLKTLLSIKADLVKEQRRFSEGTRDFKDLQRELGRTKSAIEECRKRL